MKRKGFEQEGNESPVKRTKPTVRTTEELKLVRDVYDLIGCMGGVLLLVGAGSKGQYANVDETRKHVDIACDLLDKKFGMRKWATIYGGDPLNEAKPDIALIARHIQTKFRSPLIAITSDKVRDEWGGVDKHVDYVHYCSTQLDAKGEVVWAGWSEDGGLLGASEIYWSQNEHDDRVRPASSCGMINAVMAVGGGMIALQDVQYAVLNKIPVALVKAKAKFPDSVWSTACDEEAKRGSDYGPVVDWIESLSERSFMIYDGVSTV
jgi:hypothetical protein